MTDPNRTFSMDATRGSEPVSRARLVVVHPAIAWESVVTDEPLVIGREGTAQPIAHRTVSRRHVEVRWVRGTGHVVVELGSHNGSRVDGAKLTERPIALADGAVLALGEVYIIYERLDHDLKSTATDALPGRSARIDQLRTHIARAAQDPSPVLLLGETGTGKELAAGEVHRRSKRRGAFVALNCAALSPQLVESQLFGHVRGAFTGATAASDGLFRAADGGTLFLDEIGELPLELQPKLLRVLQDREVLAVGATKSVRVDVRVIAATNRHLAAAVNEGAFRRDLYARLAMWELRVPSLRERRVDLLDWVTRLHAAWCTARGHKRPAPTLSPEAVETILLHAWPDNLRGLDRLVHALADFETPITRENLPSWLVAEPPRPPATPAPAIPTREEFVAAFTELAGNISALARRFGRDRRQIYRWIESHDCKAPDET